MGMLGLRAVASQHKCRSCIPKAADFKDVCFSIHLGVRLFYLGGSIFDYEDYLEGRSCCRRRERS